MQTTRDSLLNRLSIAGLSATLVGNGIGRFAFIAMMPALIQSGWFSKAEASYLSVATLVGYVVGARLSDWLLRYFSVTVLLRGAMLACAFSYLACVFQGASMPWYLLWRTAAGVGGAILMVLTAPLVLPQHSPAIRGRVGGVVFSGIGLGMMVAGATVPLLIGGVGLIVSVANARFTLVRFEGVRGAWIGMGMLCLMLTWLAWREWPRAGGSEPAVASTAAPKQALPPELRVVMGLLLAAYTLNAVGYLPHTLFWVDYIVRELHRPLAAGGFFWAVFGVGAAIGPLLTGTLADVFGLRRCLLAGFFLKALGVALPLFSSHVSMLFASSLLVGIFTPGIVALVSTYALECVGPAFHRKAWGMLTMSFAASQAAVGFVMARVAANLESYEPLFVFSSISLLVSVACIAFIVEKPKRSMSDAQALTA
jgi:MFS family permease